MEESTKHEKPPKYGALVYDGSQKVQEAEIGYYICPVCQEKSKLIQRQAPGFKNILSVCMRGHTCELVKTLYEKYKVNDRIRQYSSTFGKEARIRLDTYCEGTIVKSYPGLVDYLFDFRIDKCVSLGQEIKAPVWIIGHMSVANNHHDKCTTLIKKALSVVTYTQGHFTVNKGEIYYEYK